MHRTLRDNRFGILAASLVGRISLSAVTASSVSQRTGGNTVGMESRKEGRQDSVVVVNMYSGTIQIRTPVRCSESERSNASKGSSTSGSLGREL